MQMKAERGKAEQICHIHHLVVGRTCEVNPTEHQRERNGDRQQASPENQLMHSPTRPRALLDERLSQQMSCRHLRDRTQTAKDSTLFEKLPASPPIQVGW